MKNILQWLKPTNYPTMVNLSDNTITLLYPDKQIITKLLKHKHW